MLEFSRRYPEAQTVKLTRDYRSTPQVVQVANDIILRGRPSHSAGLTLLAQRPSGPDPSFAVYDDDVAEADGTVDRIRRLIQQGVKASEIAVLFRTNAQSASFETALAQAGIGYVVRGGERFFARRDVREAIVLLRGAMRATPPDASLGAAVREILTGAGWNETPPATSGAVREKWDALQALVALADDLEAQMSPAPTMETFITELDDRANAQHAPTIEGVTLASLHAAKGLEWDAVFLVGMSEGLMPISLAEGQEAINEERRLLYVGITRAREHLQLSFARARTAGGRAGRKPSRFLAGIWPAVDGPEPARAKHRRSRAGRRQDVAEQVAAAEADPELFERLRQWRAQVATETDKPAFTILHDSTLVAIAAAQPKDLRQLALLRGIGPTKLEAYGPSVLALIRGEQPPAA